MTVWAIILCLALGAGVGVVVTLLVTSSIRQVDSAVNLSSSMLPRGVAELVSLIEIPLVIVDGSGEIVAMSPGTEDLGLTKNARFVSQDVREIVRRVRATGRPVTKELEFSRGRLSASTVTLSLRADRFGASFVLVVIADKTEMRRLEEVRRDFVANISHELKTPIGAVTLLAEALNQAADDPTTVRHFAERLSDEAERLATLTREIIDLSKLQADEGLEPFKIVDLNDVVAAAVDHNQIAARSRDLEFVVGHEEKAIVMGDSARLVMAVSNLIANAIAYSTPPGRIGIGITDTGKFIEVAVTDNGIGMTKEETERVFERFYRTDKARSRSTGGTGLGLSMVKHIVNHHDGDVRVWSKPGSGSTFTIRIPSARPQKDSDQAKDTTKDKEKVA
jgi:two-component system sensor histidine kinase SenX3